jgi:hypothetical protein
MFKLIFSNRYAALIWVGLALFGAAAFVGEGGGVEALDQTAQKFQAQQTEFNSDQPSEPADLEAEPEDEEEPVSEPSETPSPVPGEIITGQDGRSYRVIQAAPSPVPAPVEQPVN